MKNFHYSSLAKMSFDGETVHLMTAIYREMGRQEYYQKIKPEVLEKLVEIAKVQSTEASNAIEGIRTTDARLNLLMRDKTAPRNRNEQEIMGYRNALAVIHESYQYIHLTPRYILQLHKILFDQTGDLDRGQLKRTPNVIAAVYPDGHAETIFEPLSPFETPEALEQICLEYQLVIGNGSVDPLIAIPTFIHDFLCIHPFKDGNGRMSRLLTTMLLYQNGFDVGKYISLENRIHKNKEGYYHALSLSQLGWHKGKENKLPYIRYFLGMMIGAYNELSDRFQVVEDKKYVSEMVREASYQQIGKFTKKAIREYCPYLSDSSIEGGLRKMLQEGEIVREGTGRATYYYRIK